MKKSFLMFLIAAGLVCPGMICPALAASDLDDLKALIAQQQRQIDQLRQTLQEQSRLLEALAAREAQTDIRPASSARGIGEIASTTAILPTLPAATTLATPLPAPQAAVAAPSDAILRRPRRRPGEKRGPGVTRERLAREILGPRF